MPLPFNSPSTQVSSGIIAPQWAEFKATIDGAFGDPAQTAAAQAIFYVAYLRCYNTMITALRGQPQDISLITHVIKSELDKYFEEI